MTAPVGPGPKFRKRSNTLLMPAMLAAIWASVSRGRWLSLSEGSPTLLVPPPIRGRGRWPVCCSLRSIMIWISDPTCRLEAVASKPI